MSKDKDPNVRSPAAWSLGNSTVIPRAMKKDAIERLFELSRDEYRGVRGCVLRALGRSGTDTPRGMREDAVNIVLRLSNDKESSVRGYAAQAFGRMMMVCKVKCAFHMVI